jgi:hypothetical protein
MPFGRVNVKYLSDHYTDHANRIVYIVWGTGTHNGSNRNTLQDINTNNSAN